MEKKTFLEEAGEEVYKNPKEKVNKSWVCYDKSIGPFLAQAYSIENKVSGTIGVKTGKEGCLEYDLAISPNKKGTISQSRLFEQSYNDFNQAYNQMLEKLSTIKYEEKSGFNVYKSKDSA